MAENIVGVDACIDPRVHLAAEMMAASQQSWHARAVQCPTGALIAARPRNASIRPYSLIAASYAVPFTGGGFCMQCSMRVRFSVKVNRLEAIMMARNAAMPKRGSSSRMAVMRKTESASE